MPAQWLITGNDGYIGTALNGLLPMHGVEYHYCDLKAGTDYRYLADQTFDVVIHLAAFVSVMDSFVRPDSYLQNNALGLYKLLKRNSIGKFIFISTGGAMYGNARHAFEYDARWDKCMSPYAQSKYLGEKIVEECKYNHVILRLANVFGGNHRVRGEAAVHGHFLIDNPIVVYGGEQTRDFVHVRTVCQAIINAATFPMIRGIYNIGSGKETKIASLAYQLGSWRQVPVTFEPKRAGEVDFITLNSSKAIRDGLIPAE